MPRHPTSPQLRPASIAAAVHDGSWLAHRYDPGHDAVHFVHVPREARRAATFLTDEHLPAAQDAFVVRRSDAIAAGPATAPLHFLFHSAYCCSTLLVRALDRAGTATGLKEPVILNDVIGWRRRGGKGPDMADVLDDVLTLLARGFTPGEAVIVKPSTAVNALAPAMMALRPAAQALLLYAPLRTFLASIASKGLDGRLWARTLLLGMTDDGIANFGFSARDHLTHTDLQIAALAWLGQHKLFVDLVSRFGAARVRTLDSATLMADPAAAIAALAGHYRLALDSAALTAIVAGPAFTRHSKFGTSFDANDRDAAHREATRAHADEIEKVAIWAEAVAATMNLPLAAPAQLLP